MAIATSSSLDYAFQAQGNLAFYDGWHPTYFYFNTLSSYGQEHKNGWIPNTDATDIAKRARADALAHMHFNSLSEESATDEIITRFLQITMFLTTAYNYELNNEIAYFKEKHKQFQELFSKEEINAIKPLAELLDIFQAQSNSGMLSQSIGNNGIDYKKFITLINVLLTGIKNTKTIAKYEEKRITQMNAAMNKLLQSRGAQAAGIKKRDHEDTLAQSEAAIRAENRLKKEWKLEYLENHNLTSTHKGKRRVRFKDKKTGEMSTKEVEMEIYNVFGGATFSKEVDKTVDVVLAHWTTDAVSKIINKPSNVRELAKYLHENFPTHGNWSDLEPIIQQKIILLIQEYGKEHLQEVIDSASKKLAKSATKRLVQKITGDSKLFDTVTSCNVTGLENGDYGQKGRRLKLFNEVSEAWQIGMNSSEKLYDAMSKLIELYEYEGTKNERKKMTKEQSLLIRIFKDAGYAGRQTEMDKLIKRVQQLQDEVDKKQKAYDQKLIELVSDTDGKPTNQLKTNSFLIDQDESEVEINFIIVNGKVTVDMQQVNQALKETSAYQLFGFKEFNAQSLRTTIGGLKKRASTKMTTDLNIAINMALNSGKYKLSQSQMINRIKQGLQNLQIKITGPTLSELENGLELSQRGSELIVRWVKGTGKNDVVSISLQMNNIINAINTSSINQAIIDNFTKQAVPILMNAKKNFLNEWENYIEMSVSKVQKGHYQDKYTRSGAAFIKQLKGTSTDTKGWNAKLRKKYEELQKVWSKYETALRKAGVEDDKIEEMRNNFLNNLSDSFYVSSTVKTFNTYQNDVGFVGGSLGSNFSEQLNRLADIFKNSGLPIDDLGWLKSAIINCSPLSVTKEENKNLIEGYLGSLAAFALFDEGAAEGKIINQFINQIEKGKNTSSKQSNILHLYRVNGIYVPGSFVLKKILDSIQNDIIPQIQKVPDLLSKGAGISIINRASTSFIPNRPISKYLHNTGGLDTNPWSTVGTEVANNISIKILFLAGLLDIVNSINAEMQDIELPQ